VREEYATNLLTATPRRDELDVGFIRDYRCHGPSGLRTRTTGTTARAPHMGWPLFLSTSPKYDYMVGTQCSSARTILAPSTIA
jgi:hypothetical protein